MKTRDATTLAVLADCREIGLPDPELEYHFALPERRWRFDVAWPDSRVALEIDGEFGGGRGVTCHVCKNPVRMKLASGKWWRVTLPMGHATVKGRANDRAKDNAAALRGWIVLRYSPNEIRDRVHVAHLESLQERFIEPAQRGLF